MLMMLLLLLMLLMLLLLLWFCGVTVLCDGCTCNQYYVMTQSRNKLLLLLLALLWRCVAVVVVCTSASVDAVAAIVASPSYSLKPLYCALLIEVPIMYIGADL